MNWFRLYDVMIDDPKVLRLSAAHRWAYVAILCISNRQPERGSLPPLEDVAVHLRMSVAEAEAVLDQLCRAGLLDRSGDGDGFAVHGWDKRQRKSDDVTARVAAWRGNNDVTLQGRCTQRCDPVTANVTETLRNNFETLPTRARSRAHSPSVSVSVSGKGGAGENQTPPADPELDRVAHKAADLACDIGWASWVVNQSKIGHPAFAIDYVVEKCAAKRDFDSVLASGILRKMAAKKDDYAEARPRPDRNGTVPYRSKARDYPIIPAAEPN